MNNKNVALILIDSVLNFIPTVLSILLPILFLPVTAEFFEFNKLTLLAVAVMLMLVVWGIKIFLTRNIELSRSPFLDFPMLLLTVIFILSTIFSLNKTASLFGSYGRWFPSLFGILNLVIFYYAVSSNLNDKKLIKFSVIGTLLGVTLNSFISALSYYNVYIGTEAYFKLSTFSLTGSIATTVMMAVLGTVLAMAMMVYENNTIAKSFYVGASVVNLFIVLLIGGLTGWIILASGMIGFFLFSGIERIKSSKMFLLVLAGILAGTLVALNTPATKKLLVNPQHPQEIALPFVESWAVSSGAMRDFPILGTGPSTFYLDFPRYKSLSLNTTNLWNARFDKPYNELFNILGTLGLIGTAVAIFFALRTVKFVWASRLKQDETGINQALSAGIITILTIFLFSYATVTASFVFFLFLSLLVAQAALDSKVELAGKVGINLTTIGSVDSLIPSQMLEKNRNLFHYLIVVPFMGLAIASGYFTFKNYMGEYYTRKAIISAQAGDGKSYSYQAQAVNINPRVAEYHNSYAITSMAIAINMSQKTDLSDDEKKTQQDVVSEAIRNVRITTEVLDPLNVVNWEIRGGIYRSLIGAAQDADKWAVDAYNTAINIDPTNAALRLTLGGVYFLKEDYLSAANQFGQAVRLNTSYANAYYNLGQSLGKLKRYDDAKRAYEAAQGLEQKHSGDYTVLMQEIEKLKSLASGESKPTVEELARTGKEKQMVQEPLSKVGSPAQTLESTATK